MKVLLIVMMTMNYIFGMDTIICRGNDESYKCEKYDGSDYTTYDYAEVYLSDVIHVYESDNADYGRTDFYSDDKRDKPRLDSVEKYHAPTYQPFYFLPLQIGPVNSGPFNFNN